MRSSFLHYTNSRVTTAKIKILGILLKNVDSLLQTPRTAALSDPMLITQHSQHYHTHIVLQLLAKEEKAVRIYNKQNQRKIGRKFQDPVNPLHLLRWYDGVGEQEEEEDEQNSLS